MRRLEGHVAVVTGGNTGIGEATTRRLASEGASVGIAYFEDHRGADDIAKTVRTEGTDAIALFCDVRDRSSVETMAETVRNDLGPVTTLVNNAGISGHAEFLDTDEERWNDMLQTHLYGAYRCAQIFLPDMIAAGRGSIINVSSELALKGEPRLTHYITAKSGLIGLTKGLAHEFGPHGVRVNSVAPGPTDTRMLTDEERSDEYQRQLPLQRLGRPSDIASAIAYLASSDADWVTGQIHSPNGGAVIY